MEHWKAAQGGNRQIAQLSPHECNIEVVGIICFTCKCGEKYVINTTKLKNGAWFVCSCGGRCVVPRSASLQWRITPEEVLFRPPDDAMMMPLSEYKTKVAEWVVTGKKPKTPAKHKKAVEFDSKGVDVSTIAKSLTTTLGLDNKDAVEKIKSAIQLDILAEEDIVKYILTQI
jgi:hypothetical protein